MADEKKNQFIFEISLSVLNHLGRNLYRSFATVLGEAISNSWDAGANNIWIYIDKSKNSLLIKDDGFGMTDSDLQTKFLKIGYSKRKDPKVVPPEGRSFIGRKGIGKLALLSCADKIHVISKTLTSEYAGGVIDNTGLDKAIENDLTPDKYPLETWDAKIFENHLKEHQKGTIIYFENIKEGIKNSLGFLKKTIALYFRFSLLDTKFNIYVNDEKVNQDDLNDLGEKTEFLWKINEIKDPYIDSKLTNLKVARLFELQNEEYKGFIASVEKPKDLKIINIDERVSVDLFVNGRLRERDILKHIPTSRVVENYLYGQIHVDSLDDDIDRFTTSRESIIAEDPKYKEILKSISEKILKVIIEDWDNWRRDNKKPGDAENMSIPIKQRRAEELFNAVSDEYRITGDSPEKKKIDSWVNALASDATFNYGSYADCFISENLIRKYIFDKEITLSQGFIDEITDFKGRESRNKKDGNINIELRQINSDLSYLDMKSLSSLADRSGSQNSITNDAKEYRPIRDALMHTALLSDEAKRKLTSVYDNIKGRIVALLSPAKS